MPTIADYMQDLNERIFLPGLQREFVWDKSQTSNLFDSLIREYPVGMITRWDVAHSDADYFPYEFVQDFVDDNRVVPEVVSNEGYQRYNKEIELEEEPGTLSYLVIDGQQRLTSLFIGLLGQRIDYTKGAGGSRSNINHWSVFELCVNLFGHPDFDNDNLTGDYEFKFRKIGEYGDQDQTGYVQSEDGTERFWFPLPRMMADDRTVRNTRDVALEVESQIDQISVDEDRRDLFKNVRSEVQPKIESRILDANLPKKDVKKPSPEIKEIFQRINIEGESPDPYQLLLSRMMSVWPFTPPSEKQMNPRGKTEEWISQFKRSHESYDKKIGREIFMRYSMYLVNGVLKTKPITQLKDDKLLEIRDKWLKQPPDSEYDEIECQRFRDALDSAFESLTTLGFSANTMNTTAMIAALGKFYYYNPNASPSNDENLEQIYRFVSKLRLLKSSKGSLGRVEATRISRYLHMNIDKDYDVFPADEVFDHLDVEIARETVEKMVSGARYSTGNTDSDQFTDWEVAAILNLATPTFEFMNVKNIQVDHIFPKSKSEEVFEKCGAEKDDFTIHRVGNLQLLTESENREKGAKLPMEWIDSFDEAEQTRYRRVNKYPDTILKPENYQEFVRERERKIIEAVADEVTE